MRFTKFLVLVAIILIPRISFSATVTEMGETWNTTAGNKTVVATPNSSDLIVVVHCMSGWAAADISTITDNNAGGGGTYTRYGNATTPLSTGGGTAGACWISVRNALISSATSTTFTATSSGDTGGGLTVLNVSGMARTGSLAAKQAPVGQSTQTENPTAIALGAASTAGNPLIIGVFGEDSPAGITAPTGFTETTDGGWATPTTGIEVAYDSDGNTATTYTYQAGGALTDHNEVIIELDVSSPPACTAGLNMMLLGVGGCP